MPEPLNKDKLRQTAAYLLKNRSIYLLPNLFTTAALFSGFFAVVSAMGGRFESASMAIFVAMVFDGLDGRVARLTHTQSAFGVEYDSLSDMVSFGVAPALVIYEWALKATGKLGWAAAFVFCAAAALRLARFNTSAAILDKRYFQGLPSPAAAGIIAGTVWTLTEYNLRPDAQSWHLAVVWAITVIAGLLMVSNVPYYSGKDFNFRKRVSMSTIMVLAIVIVLVAVFANNLAEILLVFFALYALSGLFIGLLRLLRSRRASDVAKTSEPPDPGD